MFGLMLRQVTAIGYDRLWSWPVIVIVGYGFVGVEVVSISAIVIAVSLITLPYVLFVAYIDHSHSTQ
jgi:hypothetical protein